MVIGILAKMKDTLLCNAETCAHFTRDPENLEDSEWVEGLGEVINAWSLSLSASKHVNNMILRATEEAQDLVGPSVNRDTRIGLVRMRNQAMAQSFEVMTGAMGPDAKSQYQQALRDGHHELLESYMERFEAHMKSHAEVPECLKGNIPLGDGLMAIDQLNPFHETFMMFEAARMALVRAFHEETAQMMRLFSPSNIGTLPPDFLDFIAHEIALAKESVLLRYLGDSAFQEQNYATDEYLAENQHSETAKAMLSGLAVGVSVQGGVQCPANEYGICSELFSRISPVQLPDVITDISRKRHERAQKSIAALRAVAARRQLNRWWDVSTVITAPVGETGTGQPRRNRRRSGSPQTSVEAKLSYEEEVQRIYSAEIWVGNSTDVINVDLTSIESLDSAIEDILGSKEFRDYTAKYQHEKDLTLFLASALRTILTRHYYAEDAIRRVINAKTLPSPDGEASMRMFRLAGHLAFSDKVATSAVSGKTRIIFWHAELDGVRKLKISGPRHKSDIENLTETGKLHLQ